MQSTAALLAFALAWTLLTPSALATSAARSSVVLVSGSTPSGIRAFASGVIVGTNAGLRVATAAHVAKLDDLEVQTQSGESLRVTGSEFISGYDLAVLQTVKTAAQYTPARRALSATNEDSAEVWGYGAQSVPRMVPAVILSISLRFPGSEALPKLAFACDRCEHGDSGAGIFSADGALIGILAARWSDRGSRLSIMEGEPASAIYEITASK
ncbi:MAG: hypothetical protein NVS9B12_00270 [Vulcanimicrobiaceae bacterium]